MLRVVTGILLFAIGVTAGAYSDLREFQEGMVFWEFAPFRSEEASSERLEQLRSCGTCPGIDGYFPELVTTKIWLTRKQTVFVIPKALTADLFNPHLGASFRSDTFSVKEDDGLLKITASGGDGTGSYQVSFTVDFSDGSVVRRIWQHPDSETPSIEKGRLQK